MDYSKENQNWDAKVKYNKPEELAVYVCDDWLVCRSAERRNPGLEMGLRSSR